MNLGIDQDTLVIIVWGLAALVLAWTWVPAFIAALGGTRYSCGVSNAEHSLEPSAREPDYSFWAEQLLALGYEPLGAGWMRVSFAGPEWSLFSVVRVFNNTAKNCYAYMEKAPAPFNFWPGAVFATCFANGALLLTDNNRAVEPHPDDECIRQGIVTLKLAEVEAFHLATLEALRGLGRKPDPELNAEALLHATEQHDGPEARRTHSRAGTQYLFAHGLIHICVSIPAAYLLGFAHWSVPLANLVLALVLLLGESSQKRHYARAVRAALRIRQALPVAKRGELNL
jgi:hypothetical protein